MDLTSTDIQHKRFRTKLMGLDPREVETFCQGLMEEIQRLKAENSGLRRDVQEGQRELKEYQDREKAIRNVLLNAQKAVENMKENAEKEAGLIVSEAELQAEKILQAAHQRLTQLHGDITELKRHRVQLEIKLRSTIESYRQLLDMDKEDENDSDPENKVAYLNPKESKRT
jgi:cell division initiation protein